MVELSKKNKCIFLDRDGTLNKALIKDGEKNFKLRPPYNLNEFELYDDIAVLNQFSNEYLLIIISNQPDLVTSLQTKIFHKYINAQILKKIDIKEFFFCKCLEHDPKCKCYKPRKSMIQKVINKYNISLSKSFFIGDTWRDIKLANNINIKSILINRGFYKKMRDDFIKYKAYPNFKIKNFNQLKYIIS